MLAFTHPTALRVLLVLGRYGALEAPSVVTTTQLSEILNVSQQTVSRWLIELQEEQLIEKVQTRDGLKISITTKGEQLLKQVYFELQGLFHEVPKFIRGEVAKGLGEGGYYIGLTGYMNQFEAHLGWKPYPGTLNVRLITEDNIEALNRLLKAPYILIKGFYHEDTKRTLGKVFLWHCEIQYENRRIDGAIIHPDRTHHKGIMELLAPKCLREEWHLRDGDVLIVRPKQLV